MFYRDKTSMNSYSSLCHQVLLDSKTLRIKSLIDYYHGNDNKLRLVCCYIDNHVLLIMDIGYHLEHRCMLVKVCWTGPL